MKRLAILGFGGVALALGGLGFTPQGRRPAPPLPAPLEAYPDEDMLGHIAKLHLEAPKERQKRFLMIVSWSMDGSTANWDTMFVDRQAKPTSHRAMSERGFSGGDYGNVRKSRDPKTFQWLLDWLGPSDPAPPLKHLMIVSFTRDGKWTTRIYDRQIPSLRYKAVYDYLFEPDPPRTSTGSLAEPKSRSGGG